MTRHLRILLMLVVTMLTTAAMAQVPISGTYTIQNKATQGYVQVKNRYYAKPDATSASDASKIYVGVGVKNDKTLDVQDGKVDFRANEPESYRLYSLAMKDGNAAANGATNIECYNYLNTAVRLARGVASRVVNKLYTTYKDQSAASAITGMFKHDTLQAFVDSVITYYRDDYAYLTIQPLNPKGNLTNAGFSTDVYAKVTIPEMPESAEGLYQYYKAQINNVKPDSITDADLWTFAKKFVLERIHNKWGNDPTKKDFIGYVDRNFLNIKCATTYYLTADQEGGGFGYCEEADLPSNQKYATWTMALIDPDQSAQVRKTVHIQNVASEKYVDVKGTFDAEPDYTMKADECATVAEDNADHNRTHITVKMSRFTSEGAADAKVNDNLYQITTLLSNDGQDVEEYMQKIRRKVTNYAYSKALTNSYVKSFAEMFYDYAGHSVDEEVKLLSNDVKMAVDIVCQEYLKLKVRKVNDNYMLYFNFPAVPDVIGVLFNSSDKEAGKTEFWNTVKEGLMQAVAQVDAKDTVKVKRNLDKVNPGNTYYLTADEANTFDYAKTDSYNGIDKVTPESKALWNLTAIAEKEEVADVTPDMKAGKAPIAGTYTIKNKQTGKFVEVKSKYYARPDVDEANASQIYVGVGPKNDNDTLSYRLFSLGTDKAKDGTTAGIECYDYLDKAVGWSYALTHQFIENYFKTTNATDTINVPVFGDMQLQDLEGLADSVVNYYRDDYAYLSIQPVEGQEAISKAGETTDVYAKVTIPAVPEIANQLYKKLYFEQGKGTYSTLWMEAKRLVLKKLNEKYGDDPNKTDVMGYINRNLMNIQSNTTYFLTADADPVGGFDYCKGSEVLDKKDLAVWTMTMVKPDETAQKIGTFHIQNVGTKLFVAVDNSKKYEAEPNKDFSEIDIANVDSEVFKDHVNSGTHIYVDYRRYNRNNKTSYQMSELSEGGQDVNRYLWKIHDLAVQAMDRFGEKYRKTINEKISSVFVDDSNDTKKINDLTTKFINDAKMAVDMVAREYLKLKIRDNGDGTVSLYHEFPNVPAPLEALVKAHMDKEGLWHYLKSYIKTTLDNEYASKYPDAVAKIERNIENVNPGNTYFLTAEEDSTFDYVTADLSQQDVAKWGLTNVEGELDAPAIPMTEEEIAAEGVKPLDGFFHIASGYDSDNSIVQVTDYAWAAPCVSKEDAKTLPGTVIYVKGVPVKRNGVLQYRLTNLRSQGIEVIGKTDSTYTQFYESLKNGNLDASLRRVAEQGYAAWLSTGMKAFLYGIARHMDGDSAEGETSSLANKFIAAVDSTFDTDIYITPTKLKDGNTEAYFLSDKTMNLKSISDFYAANKADVDKALVEVSNTLKANNVPGNGDAFSDGGVLANMGYTGTMPTTIDYSAILSDPELLFYWLKMEVVNMLDKNSDETKAENYKKAVASLLVADGDSTKDAIEGFVGGLQNIYADQDLGNLVANYFRRINYKRFYYLLNGWFNNGKGGSTPSNPGIFGFANNNAATNYYGSEVKNAGDAAKWVMTELNKDNSEDCFGLKFNTTLTGYRDGHFYGTMYVDFPVDVKASKTDENGLRFYYVNSTEPENKDIKNADGTTKSIKVVTLDEYEDVVPAGAPVVVESMVSDAASNKMVPVVAYDKKAQGGDMLKGSFFPVGQTRVYDSGENTTQKNLGKVIYDFINVVFGVITWEEDETIAESKWVRTQFQKMLGIDVADNDRTYTLWKSSKADDHNPMGFFLYRNKNSKDPNQFKALAANKAFLYVKDAVNTTGGAKIYIGGDDITTGIGEIVAPANQQKDVVYDIQGRRVNNPRQGVYIINGKKVLIMK